MDKDSKLRQAIYSQLRKEDDFRYADIDVTVRDGVAILNGYVPQYEMKARAYQIASRVPGLVAVLEELEELPVSSDDESSLKDEEIAGWTFI